jgi:hypothetical protein
MAEYRIAGIEELQLHHFYRAMSWLGEQIAGAAALHQGSDRGTPVRAPPLFVERSFTVFIDSTSLSFLRRQRREDGAYGHSKDHRADLKQMILAVVIDGEGRPICTEMLPGNTADATMLLPVVDRLRERFHIGRCASSRTAARSRPPRSRRWKRASWNTLIAAQAQTAGLQPRERLVGSGLEKVGRILGGRLTALRPVVRSDGADKRHDRRGKTPAGYRNQ